MKPTVEREETSNRTLLQAPTQPSLNGFLTTFNIQDLLMWFYITCANASILNLFNFSLITIGYHANWPPCYTSHGWFRWIVKGLQNECLYLFSFANLSSLNVEILLEPIPTGCLYYCGIILGWSRYRPWIQKNAHLRPFYGHLKYPCSHSPQ